MEVSVNIVVGKNDLPKAMREAEKATKAFSKSLGKAMTKASSKMTETADVIKKVTANIGKMGGKSGKTTRSIKALNTQLDKLKKAKNISISIKGVKKANDQVAKSENKTEKSKTSKGGGIGKSLLSMAKGGLGAAGIATSIDPAEMVKKAAELGAEREKTTLEFEIALGGADKAESLMGKLNSIASASPLTNQDLFSGAQTLLDVGAKAGQIPNTLKMIGDVAMGNAEKMSGLTKAYAQVSEEGKLTKESLTQMNDQGFKPLEVMSQATGLSVTTLKKKMEQGAISSQMVGQAFVQATAKGGTFFEGMKKQSETAFGKASIMTGMFNEKLTNLGQSVILPLIGAFSELGIFVMNNATLFGGLALAVGAFYAVQQLGALMTFIKGLGIIKVLTGQMTMKQWLLNSAMLANPIGLVLAGIVGLGAAFVWAWNKFDGFRGAIVGGWEVINKFGSAIKDGIVAKLKNLGGLLSGIGKAVGLMLKGEFSDASNQMSNTLQEFKKKSEEIGEKERKTFTLEQVKKTYAEGDEKGRDEKYKIKLPSFLTNPKGGMGGLPQDSQKVDNSIFNTLKEDDKKKDGLGNELAKGSTDASTSGNRAMSFSIKIEKMIESLVVKNENATETAQDITDKVLEKLLSAFNELGLQSKTMMERV